MRLKLGLVIVCITFGCAPKPRPEVMLTDERPVPTTPEPQPQPSTGSTQTPEQGPIDLGFDGEYRAVPVESSGALQQSQPEPAAQSSASERVLTSAHACVQTVDCPKEAGYKTPGSWDCQAGRCVWVREQIQLIRGD